VIGHFLEESMWVWMDIRPAKSFCKKFRKNYLQQKSPQLPLLMLIKFEYNNLMASDLQRCKGNAWQEK